MSTLENIHVALGALWANRLRSFLALLGVIIGTFAITTLISLGEMATVGVRQNLERAAGRSITVFPLFSEKGEPMLRLRQRDLQALAALGLPVIGQSQTTSSFRLPNGKLESFSLVGTPGDLPRLDPTVRLSTGRYFSASEANLGKPLAVVNRKLAQSLYMGKRVLGRTVRVVFSSGSHASVTVVGILEDALGNPGGFDSPRMLVPNEFLWRYTPDIERETYDTLRLVLRPQDSSSALEERVRKILRTRHDERRLLIQSSEVFQQMLIAVTRGLQAVLGAIGGLSLIVGGLGITNIMLANVTERTSEIGLRKALGATSSHIRQQFLVESLVLTGLGGLLGVALSVATLGIAVLVIPFLDTLILSPFTVFLALGLSMVVGLLAGVWPASQAAKLEPIEALRYE